MPMLARVRGLLRSLAGRGPIQRDLDADIGGCFDMLVDEKTAAGMSPEEARREARLELGGVEQVKEAVRAVRPAAWLDTIVRDVRYSVRLLAKTPAFSLTAILVLALGIGANSAAFSLINVLLFRPLPGESRPGIAVAIYTHDPSKPDSYRAFSYREYEEIRDSGGPFDYVMAHGAIHPSVVDGGLTRATEAELATGSYFETLGVRLAAGRSFTRDEERPGSRAAVLVLSHVGWQRRGAPADILGQTVLVNAHPFTVIGVAPEGFTGRLALLGPEFWLPLGAAELMSPESRETPLARIPPATQRSYRAVGRLRAGLTIEGANAAMRLLSARLRQTRSPDESPQILTVSRLARLSQGNRPYDEDETVVPLSALMGAALIVLVVASLNVANMQLARGSSRRKEIAMRLALGAGRSRVAGQLLIEGLVLAVAGGGVGLLLAVWAMRVMVASLTPLVQYVVVASVAPDWRVCLAALVFCALAAIASGCAPAWRLSRLDVLPEMKSLQGTNASRRLRHFGPRRLLVAGQITLSLALLVVAGLFVRGAVAASQADPGYRLDRQFLLRVDAASSGYDEAGARDAGGRLMARLRSTPGIESAAMASTVAFGPDSSSQRVSRSETASTAESGASGGIEAQVYIVGSAYFRTLGLPMLRGREFTEVEESDPRATGVVIIDEPLAAAIFPGQDPIGRLIQLARSDGRPRQIVGVAPGLRHRLTDRGPVPHVYLPAGPSRWARANIHVRAAAGSATDDLRQKLRDMTRAADTRLGLLAVQTMEEARDEGPINWLVRSAGRTFGAFGAISLFMATIGLYGVKAYLVACRTREIGIRTALGATPRKVIRMIVGEGAMLLAISVVAGFLLAVGLGRLISSLLVGVSPFDPLVLSIATLALSVAVFAGCYVPARRVTRISPVTALRVE